MTDPVRAAGGVLYRPTADGREIDGREIDGREICLVHRPRYDDWSLPKGKLHDGEHVMAGAVREVAEETGVRGRPEMELSPVSYELPDGRTKTVHFWLMRAHAEGPVTDVEEVDRLEWLPVPAALERLTYPADREVLGAVAGLPPVTALVAAVRHAHAGERKNWSGNDALRPLDPVGQAEAERLTELLQLLAPKQLISATPLRCKQTIEPLAAALGGMPIVIDGTFTEPPAAEDAPAKAKLAAQRLLDLRAGGLPVICSQGKVMPSILATLFAHPDPDKFKTPKGTGWLLTWCADRLLAMSRL